MVRGIAACAAPELEPHGLLGNEGVVAAQVDLAVVEKKSVGDSLETFASLIVTDANRLRASVAAGHDERIEWRRGIVLTAALEEKQMQRRGGEHDAEGVCVGGDEGEMRDAGCGMRDEGSAFAGPTA